MKKYTPHIMNWKLEHANAIPGLGQHFLIHKIHWWQLCFSKFLGVAKWKYTGFPVIQNRRTWQPQLHPSESDTLPSPCFLQMGLQVLTMHSYGLFLQDKNHSSWRSGLQSSVDHLSNCTAAWDTSWKSLLPLLFWFTCVRPVTWSQTPPTQPHSLPSLL